MFNIRTDLALEAKEIYENDQKSTEIPGVKVKNKDLETTMDFAGYYYDLYRQFFAWFIDFKNSHDKNLDGKKILDLGCDNGITTCFVANLYPNSEIIGVDKCKKGIKCAEEIAQKLGVKNVKFEAVDAKKVDKFFKEEKFDLGRMFGFAYGEKENGAVFSHMAVMYSNALYQRGFAKEGNKVLQALLDAAMEFDNSKMYPGLPEYFDNQGRGLYAYLTGAASWYMLTMITEVFGVKGDCGDLKIAPALMPEQYNQDGKAVLKMTFAGRNFEIIFYNKEKKEFNQLKIRKAVCDGKALEIAAERCTILSKREIQMLSVKETHKIEIELV